MPTIKMSGGKVVTKAGKVSCSCCDLTCCMYSANAFANGVFTVADLMDEITVFDGFSGTPYVLQKQDPPLDLGFGPVVYFSNVANSVFVYFDSSSGSHLWNIPISLASFPCLTGAGTAYEPEDEFEATYSVTGTLTGTVTRSSTCVWSVTGITLRWNSTTQKWNVNGNEKSSGNQSSPVGSYNGGFAVS